MQHYPACPEHQDILSEFLLINPASAELLCSKCLFSRATQENHIDISSIVHLKQLNYMELLQKILPKYNRYSLNYVQLVNKLKVCFQKRLFEIEKMQNDLQNLYDDTQESLANLEIIQNDLCSGIKEALDLDSLFQSFTQSNESNDNNKEQEYIFECIGKYRESYYKNYSIFKQSLLQKICLDPKNFKNRYQNQVTLLNLGSEEIQQNLKAVNNYLSQWPQPKVLDCNSLFKLIYHIERKQIKNINSITRLYLGSQDGFSMTQLIEKIHKKGPLLMIFKSQSGSIFGAFTPVIWYNTRQSEHTQDHNGISFLFSLSKNQIFDIKMNQNLYAFSINQEKGIMFGGSLCLNQFQQSFIQYQDLVIQPDFKDGYSNLGFVYNADIPQSEVPTFLFGDKEPNIVDFEQIDNSSLFFKQYYERLLLNKNVFTYHADVKEDEKSSYLFGEEEPNIVEFEVQELI